MKSKLNGRTESTDQPKKENRGGKRISYKPICGARSKSTGKACPRVAG